MHGKFDLYMGIIPPRSWTPQLEVVLAEGQVEKIVKSIGKLLNFTGLPSWNFKILMKAGAFFDILVYMYLNGWKILLARSL